MALEAKLLQKLSQNLLMTPQLQQAIKLLQLGRLEYLEAIQKELLENPVLEEVRDEGGDQAQRVEVPSEGDPSEAPRMSNSIETDSSDQPQVNPSEDLAQKSTIDWEAYLESFSDTRGAASPRGLIDYEDRPSPEASMTKDESLVEHLLSQLRFGDIATQDAGILLQVIGNLDKDGYLCLTYEEIAESCSCAQSEVARVLEIVKTLDPPGVGARDLGECLLIQLEHLGMGDGLAAKICKHHLPKLEKRKLDEIAKGEGVSVEEVLKAVSTIRTLEPRPGRPFSDESARYIVPDIYVYKVNGEYVISLNEDGLPKLRVSPYYLQVLKSAGADGAENRNYLTERLKAASWLIKSIHQRQQTIYRVTESIVKFQREFLEYGISKLKPLVLKDVANDIGMHESTVSRVTANKYVHTPQGVFELRFFFTTGIRSSTGSGGEVSSSSVKERIKNLIAAESIENPISDQALVEILKKENIDIARRTVAKYREGLGIASSSQRKKAF